MRKQNTALSMTIQAPRSLGAKDVKIFLVTSDFHCPRAEFIFRNVLDASAAEVCLEVVPARSGLQDDISDEPQREMFSGFDLKRMKDINDWGIFRRLCHEYDLMLKKMKLELCQYGLEDQNPIYFDNALEEILELIEKARRGHL